MTTELTDILDDFRADADGIVACEPESGRVVYADDKAHTALGYKPGTLAGEKLESLLPRRVLDDHDRWVSQFMGSGTTARDMSTRTIAARKSDGSMVEMNAVIYPVEEHATVFFILATVRAANLRARLDAIAGK